jgi:hypothetical protein
VSNILKRLSSRLNSSKSRIRMKRLSSTLSSSRLSTLMKRKNWLNHSQKLSLVNESHGHRWWG